MPSPLTTRTARGQLATYHDTTLGVLIVDGNGAEAAASTMQYVSEVVADEISTVDATNYVRGTIDVIYQQVDEVGILDEDPEGTPYAPDLTGGTPAGVWFYDPTGVNDAARELVAFLPVEEGPGFAEWLVQPPADGIARVRVIDDALLAAVVAAITIEGTPL